MTQFSDNIYTGSQAAVSASSSLAPVALTRSFRFTGGGNQTWSGMLPAGAQNIRPRLYIIQDGSAATTDRITFATSAGATTLFTYSSFGSAGGYIGDLTVAALGTVAIVASAAANLATAADIPFTAILSSTDTATDYQLAVDFNRVLDTF